jgi:hypothetical protein
MHIEVVPRYTTRNRTELDSEIDNTFRVAVPGLWTVHSTMSEAVLKEKRG